MMHSLEQPWYTIISLPSGFENFTESKLKNDFEYGDVQSKIEALKNLTISIANGAKISKEMLMFVIRFLLPNPDKALKKHLLIFWEVVPKIHPDGKLLSEMILVCDAYRKDLLHPNEYVRGSTLRFLCKLKESQLLEPIMPAIRQCLEHRHPYVRRNAVLATFTIYKNFEFLIPDAPQLMEGFLEKETDISCRRNAFMMLIHVDQSRALAYLKTCIDSITSFGDILQLVIVELIYDACVDNMSDKSCLIKCLFELIEANSSAVRFEAANALVSLVHSPLAIEVAAKCYVNLILKESDNNIRIILLDRFASLRSNSANERILYDLTMDLLTVLLACGNDSIVDAEVAKRVLTLVMDLLTPDRVKDILSFFKDETQRIQKMFLPGWSTKKITSANRDVVMYHGLIIKTLKNCVSRFPECYIDVVSMLITQLPSCHFTVAYEILDLVRNIVFTHAETKSLIFGQLMKEIVYLSDPRTFRFALWIAASAVTQVDEIVVLIKSLDELLGFDPLMSEPTTTEPSAADGKESEDRNMDNIRASTSQRVIITADGSYSTQSTYNAATCASTDDKNTLKRIIQEGSTYTGACVATIISKLLILYKTTLSNGVDSASSSHLPRNILMAKASMVLLKIMLLTVDKQQNAMGERVKSEVDYERVASVLSMFALDDCHNEALFQELLQLSDHCTQTYLEKQLLTNGSTSPTFCEASTSDNDTSTLDWARVTFKTIINNKKNAKNENILSKSLLLAVGAAGHRTLEPNETLDKVIQLTGLSDAVYAETYVTIVKFDIILDVFVVNQTSDILQNITLELHTAGEYKIVEKPNPIALSPMGYGNIKAGLRISSTNSNVIFGSLLYDTLESRGDGYCVVLNEIRLDLTDYSTTNPCTREEFQKMWVDFEWENKVSVNVRSMGFKEFINHLLNHSKMCLISPEQTLEDECNYLVVNMYMKNRFNDEAVANVCIEKDGALQSLVGQVRIRAKVQGVALNLGQKLSECLKMM